MNRFSVKLVRFYALLLTVLGISIAAWQYDNRSYKFKTALEGFQIEPGMRIDLIAAEPLVASPVAIAFDENKAMYVVEDRGYPDPAEGGLPTKLGRIALLKDTNGDGTYDKRFDFAEGLTYPNGILPWKGGVFVTCSPDIFYLKDTNGDGIADVKKVVLTGFYANKTAQIRMAYPILGLDGWVYVTAGLNGGNVTSPEHPERAAVSYNQADGRFNPETFEFQITGGHSQFGLTFDAYGRRFGSSNRHPVMHTVIEPWYLKRNPNLLFNETIQNVSKVEAEAAVFPISKSVTSADFIPKLIGRSHAGTFTAASGLLAYNGTGLTPAHQGNVFICESAQNLVQRQVVTPDGVSFRSEIPYKGREFLSSTDGWFRPVSLQHGPEGGLYVVDMHRKVIDHPSYVPEEARGGLDWEAGKNDGRIYRVVRKDFADRKSNTASLSASSSVNELVNALSSTEEWERQTAHRLLLEGQNADATAALRKTATNATKPESRARAIWLLHSLNALDLASVKKALTDKEPGVREQAALLAGEMTKEHPELVQTLVAAASDPAIRVRYNSALVLGSLEGTGVVEALAKVAAKDGADRWVRAAVLSGIEKRMPSFLSALRKQGNANPAAFAAVMKDLGSLYGSGGTVADSRVLFKEVLSSTGSYEWRIATLLGLAEGVSARTAEFGTSPQGLLYAIPGKSQGSDLAALNNFIGAVVTRAGNPAEATRVRMLATSLLGYTNYDRAAGVLQKLLAPTTPPELLRQAVSSLTRLNDVRGAALLTEKKAWSSYTPLIKAAVIGSLVSKPAFTGELFNAIEKGTIAGSEISSADRVRLMKSTDPLVSDRANMLFKELEGGDRMAVYQEYQKTLDAKADPVMGKAVFQKSCSACHTYQGEGGKVGPDLTGVKSQPAEALLLHILVPNYEVLPAYQSVLITTKDGRSFSGKLLSETENSLTLRTAFGTDESILRKNIASLTNSGLSLMPDGLEQSMSREDMARLIAFLKAGS
ncbi:PVC-type heme-binding CxxCH protein [Dyadobacter sp. CY323]|uniref:PVC-type heme-binding CxxCH protein n=1 Tax=Dyadobacter sp. CY323 TaxID=2907302 RepID=UPI001F3CBB34|nr:PVC-type heme-binding CxxCH protein [Dyadobacter sp. CY323]MCE6992468.1 HEAT repeat domain-containing protein [Dyadobacter sp. CY323]